jgi:hypothetical protein
VKSVNPHILDEIFNHSGFVHVAATMIPELAT